MHIKSLIPRAAVPFLLAALLLNACSSGTATAGTGSASDEAAVSSKPSGEETSEEVLISVSADSEDPENTAEESPAETDCDDVSSAAEDADPEPEAPAEETTAPVVLTAAQEQYETQKADIQAREAEISQVSEIPCIYINTLGNTYPVSKDTYLDCTVDVFNVSDASAMSGAAAGVRVRGNSSSNTENPPLKIKFSERRNLVGLHNGEAFKVWVILKPGWCMVPDHLAFKLGRTLLDESLYVSDSKFVHVYVNGIDWGICLACEQNQVQKKRVNIIEADSETTSPTDMGYFFEMDNYAGSDTAPTFWISNADTPITDINGVTHAVQNKGYTLKNDVMSNTQLSYISTYMNSLWQVLYNATYNNTAYVINTDGSLQQTSDLTPEEAVCRVLDVDSAVNTYILEEIFHDYDRGAGSFFMAVDFSESSVYKKLTFLAPWDFGYVVWDDDGTGLHTGGFTTSGDINDTDNIWLIMLYYNEWFRKLVAQRYAELVQSGALKTAAAAVDEDLNALTADAALTGQSADLSCAHQFITYTNSRIDWLAEYFSSIQ